MWPLTTKSRRELACFTFLLGLLSTGLSSADSTNVVNNAAQAKVDYMLNCQGCHGPDGAGTPDGSVPTMKNFVGRFLSVSGGREFLIRVPGAANAAVSDDRLAELMNWMLLEISLDQIPEGFEPYTTQEVARLRAQPLADVEKIRAKLVSSMSDRARGKSR